MDDIPPTYHVPTYASKLDESLSPEEIIELAAMMTKEQTDYNTFELAKSYWPHLPWDTLDPEFRKKLLATNPVELMKVSLFVQNSVYLYRALHAILGTQCDEMTMETIMNDPDYDSDGPPLPPRAPVNICDGPPAEKPKTAEDMFQRAMTAILAMIKTTSTYHWVNYRGVVLTKQAEVLKAKLVQVKKEFEGAKKEKEVAKEMLEEAMVMSRVGDFA